jgi:hypothetical protein
MLMDRYQKQRFELKYQIPATLIEPIRQFVSSYLQLDGYAVDRPDLAYPVHSLYLDSRDMRLYQSTINGDRNRYKLRIRYYAQDPQAPLFFEIKSRRDRVIRKQRSMVRRASLASLLDGRLPTTADLHEPEQAQYEALHRFCELRRSLGATPKTHVGYHREAWLSADNSVRVTLDRGVRTGPDPTARLSTELAGLTPVFGKRVVLEIKFTDRYPLWLKDLVRAFDLRQGAAAKYVDGVIALGEHLFLSAAGRGEVRRRLAMRQAG